MRWEYQWTNFNLLDYTAQEKGEFFLEIGQEGWELVNVDNGIAYFKRPLQEKGFGTIIRYRKGADRGKG